MGQLRHGVHRLPRMVVDRPDDHQHLVVPFCTYASTYRDETLAKIVELTPDAKHLKGFGAVNRNTKGLTEWLKEIKVIK